MNARGLAALTLSLFLFSPLSAEYLYKDEVIHLEDVTQAVEVIGKELHEKTGVGLYVAVLKELEQNLTIVDYEKRLMDELEQPAVLLVISEYDKQIDIFARPASLYKDFDKAQVLSPFPNSGTILPILTMKSKKATVSEKFGAAVENGYADIAEQIADSRDVTLEHGFGNANKTVFNILRLIFYGIIAYALFLYIKRKFYTKRNHES